MGLFLLATGPAPAAPTTPGAQALSHNAVRVTWVDVADNEDGVRIDRKIGAGAFSLHVTVGPEVETYDDTGLNAETLYTYRVRAFNSGGESSNSSEAGATTPAAPVGGGGGATRRHRRGMARALGGTG